MVILDYRNTPTQGMDSSPVQRLMNRCTKTLLPTSRTLLQPRMTYLEKDQRNLAKRQEQQVRYFNRGARNLRDLAEGDKRAYNVETPDRGISRRTRCHLRKTPERAESASSDDNKSTDKRVISSGEHIRPSEPVTVTLSVPKEAKQQEEACEPSKVVAASTSLTQPGPVNAQPVRPQRTRRPPEYLKDFVC